MHFAQCRIEHEGQSNFPPENDEIQASHVSVKWFVNLQFNKTFYLPH